MKTNFVTYNTEQCQHATTMKLPKVTINENHKFNKIMTNFCKSLGR